MKRLAVPLLLLASACLAPADDAGLDDEEQVVATSAALTTGQPDPEASRWLNAQ